MKIWQVSAGNYGRYYHDIFLKHGVALIGPGGPGEWTPEQPDTIYDCPYVRWFANEMQDGDTLVLRQGRAKIWAIGKVIREYEYLDQFDDVNGWDLQHGRRVRWHKLEPPHIFDRDVFVANPRRFSRVHVPNVVNLVNKFVESSQNEWQNDTSYLPELPDHEPELSELPRDWRHLQELVNQIRSFLREHNSKYEETNRFGEESLSENESTAHFVVPFLRALGWPILNIAVQWRRIDVCVFEKLPRTSKNCRFVIEVKQLYSGLEGDAINQARSYAINNDITSDNQYIVVTNGVRYHLLSANDENGPAQIEYANLEHLRESHLRLFEIMKRS